jgi:hypothetical protein
MIELGDKIKLDGFDNLDPAMVIVVKKIIGSFVKKLRESHGEFDNFLISHDNNKISAELVVNDTTYSHSSTKENIFYSLSDSLSNLNQKLYK